MKVRLYRYGELIGIVFLLVSTAMQIFYLEPLKREIDWRLVAFNTQQNAQIQIRTMYDNQIALLKALNAPADQIAATQDARKKAVDKFETADANVANYVLAKQPIEDYIQIIVIVLFAAGSLLAGIGRALEMTAAPEQR